MTECTNDEMRDLLPLLAHGSLGEGEAARVRAHLATCAACAAELAALETSRLVLRATAPRVDASAIARAVTATLGARPAAAAPTLTVERGGAAAPSVARRSVWRSRQLLAAAASILIVATVAIPFLDNGGGERGRSPLDTLALGPSASAGTAVGTTVGANSLTVGETLTDLSSDDLSALLDEIESVEALIALEPSTMRQPIVDAPEGL